jgi:thiamine biosynthesis lipoprotein
LINAVILSSCFDAREVIFTGRTMGTAYRVKVIAGPFNRVDHLQGIIDQRLADINQSMSTYIPDSEISRFNALRQTDVLFTVSKDFLQVLQVAQQIYALSDGAWDGTVKPLLDEWGFADPTGKRRIPKPDQIAARLADVGFEHIHIQDTRQLRKAHANVTLDLGSIAKGYGVDAVARLMQQQGFADFLVEIGGEVVAAGHRLDGRPWRIGINQPLKEAGYDQVYQVVPLSGKALATSGDYRNFFELDSKRYSHVLDPRTGYPVQNGVVSVSVLAQNCTLADGLATAIMVMGADSGIALLNRLEAVEGLIVVRKQDGTLQDFYSTNFPRPQTATSS